MGAHSFDTSVPVLALARVPQDAHQTTTQGRRRRAFDRPMRVNDGRARRTAGRDLWCVWGRAQKINLGASERSTPAVQSRKKLKSEDVVSTSSQVLGHDTHTAGIHGDARGDPPRIFGAATSKAQYADTIEPGVGIHDDPS